MLLMIDNYDSFTYNLVQYFGELGADVRVVRNDEITVEGIAELHIGHAIVARAVWVGLRQAVREMKATMEAARTDAGT